MSAVNPDTIDPSKPEQDVDAKTADLRSNLAAMKTNLVTIKAEIEILEAKDAALTAADVGLATGVGSPTIDQLQEYIDKTGSSGFFTGGELTDGGSGTVDVAAGEGFIRESASSVAPLLSFKWSASAGLAVPSDTVRYVFVDDTGAIALSADEFLEAEDKLLLGVVVNEAGSVEHLYNLGVRLDESIGQAGRYMRRIHGISRDLRRGGLVLGQSGDADRFVTLSTGHLWWGRTDYTIATIDTDTGGAADTFDIYYRDDSGGVTKVANASAWPNTKYDDNTGTLATLGSNKWGTLWFYLEPDGHLVMIYGREEHNSEALALDEGAPSTVLPPRTSAASVLVARMVFKESENVATLSLAFDEDFVGALITDHGSLAGLSDDDHPQYALGRKRTNVNGDFKIWQRGIDTTDCPVATETYLADMVFVTPVGATMTQERSEVVRTNNLEKYSLLLTGAASVTTVNVCLQRYEAINIPAIKGVMTFSIWVLNNSGANFNPSLLIGTPGAEDDYTTVTNRLTQELGSAIDGAYTQLTYTVDISGYTNIDNGLQVEVQLPDGSMVAEDTWNLAEFQFERSNTVTIFEYIDRVIALNECLWYYRKLADPTGVGSSYLTGFIGTSTTAFFGEPFAMRAAPIIGFSNLTLSDGSVTPAVTSSDSVVTTGGGIAFSLIASGGGLTTPGRAARLRFTGATSFIDFDANLK
jgi:hypothetical protein